MVGDLSDPWAEFVRDIKGDVRCIKWIIISIFTHMVDEALKLGTCL